MAEAAALLPQLEALAAQYGLPQLQAAWAALLARHPLGGPDGPDGQPRGVVPCTGLGASDNAEVPPEPGSDADTATDVGSSQRSNEAVTGKRATRTTGLRGRRSNVALRGRGSPSPTPATGPPAAPPAQPGGGSRAPEAAGCPEGDAPGVLPTCRDAGSTAVEDPPAGRPQTRSLTRQAAQVEGSSPVPAPMSVRQHDSVHTAPVAAAPAPMEEEEGPTVADPPPAEARSGSPSSEEEDAEEEPIGRRTRSCASLDPEAEGGAASQPASQPPAPPRPDHHPHGGPSPAPGKRRRQSHAPSGSQGSAGPVERPPKRARKPLGSAEAAPAARQSSLPLDTQRHVADFCLGVELWALSRVSAALRLHIATTPALQQRLDRYRLCRVWGSRGAPLPTRPFSSYRLAEQQGNVRDVFAANDDLVFVQLSDSRKWNANKAGRRLEVGIVATSVTEAFSYAVSSLWEYALTVPLSGVAPPPPSRDFRGLRSAAHRCCFQHSRAPVLAVFPGSLGPDALPEGGDEFAPASASPGLQPLTAAALPDGGVALRWCSGRFEFVGLEGEYCVAVVRSPGSPAELAVLHLPTRAVHRMAVSQALAYSTKVVRVVDQRVYLISFEFAAVRICAVSPEGQLGEPQLLADERCPTFTGFTDDAVVLRCREGFKLVQLPGGRVQATLPFARLGVAKVDAASYHHPSKRLVVYDGGGTLHVAAFLAPPAPTTTAAAATPTVDRPPFPVFRPPRRTRSANPAGASGPEATPREELMGDPPAHPYRFST